MLEGSTENVGQNFFTTVIRNERHMRAQEITKLFKASGVEGICVQLCGVGSLMAYFKEDDRSRTNDYLNAKLGDFFKRRNIIAHSLGTQSSLGDKTLVEDLEFFRALAQDLSICLEKSA